MCVAREQQQTSLEETILKGGSWHCGLSSSSVESLQPGKRID